MNTDPLEVKQNGVNRNQDPTPPRQEPPSTLELEDRQLGNILQRLKRALGPVLGGLILDFADFATFGPLGLFAGPIVGIFVGWWMGNFYQLTTRARIGLTLVAGIYCALPITNFLPLATMVSALIRFLETPPEAGSATQVRNSGSDQLPLTPSELLTSKEEPKGRNGRDPRRAK